MSCRQFVPAGQPRLAWRTAAERAALGKQFGTGGANYNLVSLDAARGPMTWTGDVSGAGTEWLTDTNWSPDPDTAVQHVPGASDRAVFNASGTAGVGGVFKRSPA